MKSPFISDLLNRCGQVGPATKTLAWLYSHSEQGQRITVTRIANELQMTQRQMRTHLSRLQAAGLIRREIVEPGRPNSYTILVAGNNP
jgi:predicted ArsR family transcriptional regulator